ncbi:MAG: cytochrome c family protein [Henriciella sp.]|uniref:c-type cytochrome n=1 Tax=Henriciella sp. TaxID=1968823 RepID=UPI003C7801E7
MSLRTTVFSVALGLAVTACGEAGEEPAEAAPTPPPVEETGADEAAADDTVSPASESDSAPAAQLASLPEPYASADLDRGKRVFLQCQSCHTLEEGGPVVLGPNLHGVFDRTVGEGAGFEYSEALQEADFEWTPEQLDQWLESPRAFLPGNRMTFSGLRRPDDRTAVIAYIMSQTGYDSAE